MKAAKSRDLLRNSRWIFPSSHARSGRARYYINVQLESLKVNNARKVAFKSPDSQRDSINIVSAVFLKRRV